MIPSVEAPMYSVSIVSRKSGTVYGVTEAVQSLRLSDSKNDIAQTTDITLVNVPINGTWLTALINVGDRIYINADDGQRREEVFRGFIWEKDYTSTSEKNLDLMCYDNLIYLQQSEICEFYKAGTNTKTIIGDLCDKWGINLNYDYESISHPKLPLKGTLSDVIAKDVLDEVKKQTGKKYVISSIEDTLYIKNIGANGIVYEFLSGKNTIKVRDTDSLSELVTKVVITGKTDDDERTAIEAVVDGNINDYGTLQKLISKNEDTDLSEAKQEAQELLDENGTPKKTIYIESTDIPWLKKGDKVYINAGNIYEQYAIVLSVEHDCVQKTMNFEAEFIKKGE